MTQIRLQNQREHYTINIEYTLSTMVLNIHVHADILTNQGLYFKPIEIPYTAILMGAERSIDEYLPQGTENRVYEYFRYERLWLNKNSSSDGIQFYINGASYVVKYEKIISDMLLMPTIGEHIAMEYCDILLQRREGNTSQHKLFSSIVQKYEEKNKQENDWESPREDNTPVQSDEKEKLDKIFEVLNMQMNSNNEFIQQIQAKKMEEISQFVHQAPSRETVVHVDMKSLSDVLSPVLSSIQSSQNLFIEQMNQMMQQQREKELKEELEKQRQELEKKRQKEESLRGKIRSLRTKIREKAQDAILSATKEAEIQKETAIVRYTENENKEYFSIYGAVEKYKDRAKGAAAELALASLPYLARMFLGGGQ